MRQVDRVRSRRQGAGGAQLSTLTVPPPDAPVPLEELLNEPSTRASSGLGGPAHAPTTHVFVAGRQCCGPSRRRFLQ